MERIEGMKPEFAVDDPNEAWEGALVEDSYRTRIKVAQRLNLSEFFISELNSERVMKSQEARKDYQLNKKADSMLEDLIRDGFCTGYGVSRRENPMPELRKLTEVLNAKIKVANLENYISVELIDSFDPCIELIGQVDSIKTNELPQKSSSQ